MYRFPWYLTLVSTNHASSNPGQELNKSNDIVKRASDTLIMFLSSLKSYF